MIILNEFIFFSSLLSSSLLKCITTSEFKSSFLRQKSCKRKSVNIFNFAFYFPWSIFFRVRIVNFETSFSVELHNYERIAYCNNFYCLRKLKIKYSLFLIYLEILWIYFYYYYAFIYPRNTEPALFWNNTSPAFIISCSSSCLLKCFLESQYFRFIGKDTILAV